MKIYFVIQKYRYNIATLKILVFDEKICLISLFTTCSC